MLLDTHKAEIETLVARYASRRSAVLPLLFLAQDSYGHLTDEAVREVAAILGLPPTDVFEVVGFYTLFYNRPMGNWVLQVCDDVPCCYLGAEELLDVLKRSLGIQEEQTTPDGVFTLQRVKCIAACNRAPVLQANLDYVYDVTPQRADALLRDLRARAGAQQQRGVSGRNAEDFEFAADGRLRPVERAEPARAPLGLTPVPVANESAKAAAQEEASAPAAPARAAAEERAEREAPTQPSLDGTNSGLMPRPEADIAAPATAQQREAPSAAPVVQPDAPPAQPSATGQPEPILDRPADQSEQEKKPVGGNRSPL